MFSTLASLLALNLYVQDGTAHPTKYPKLNRDEVDCTASPDILSFHTHIIYIA